MENSKFLRPEADERAESFSFSCLSNSATVFTDDGGSSSDESFFEIALESGAIRKSSHPQNRENGKEMELMRISFSSSFPLPELATNGPLINGSFERSASSFESITFSTFPSTSTISRCSSTRSPPEAKFWSAPLGRSASSFNKTLKWKLKFPTTTANSVEDQGKSEGCFGDVSKAQIQRNQEEFVKGSFIGRNMSNITNRGGMMKIFRKSKKFGAILGSFMKPRQLTLSDQVNGKRSEEILQRNRSQVTPWDRSLVQMEQGKNRGFKINLASIRGVVSFGRSERRRTMSCPSSIKSSPIHLVCSSENNKTMCARDSSIQAAIAHCKISLGQSTAFGY